LKKFKINTSDWLGFHFLSHIFDGKIKVSILFVFISTIFVLSCNNSFEHALSQSFLPTTKKSTIDGKEMVLVTAGEFIMGTNKVDSDNSHLKMGTVKPLFLDQHPIRKISLDSYYIDKYEVTNEEYKLFLDSSGYDELPGHWENGTFLDGKNRHPVTHVTWREALTYALWAQKMLPTEAQWEKAARGEDGRMFPWGNIYEKGKGNIDIDGAKKLMKVGSYPNDISPYNIYDLAGNVMEWTMDWYLAYPGSTYESPRYGKKLKVLRGNGFQKSGHYFLEAYHYSFTRTESDPNDYFENVGFRCVELIKPSA